MINPFLDAQRRLRNGWWILIFFAVVAAMLIPLLIRHDGVVPVSAQAAIVAIASIVCQLLRRRPLAELTGRFDGKWLVQLLAGCLFGAALMLLPAAFLFAFGYVTWSPGTASLTAVAATIPLILAAVVAEELMFRGFVFQRLIDGVGATLAQLILAAYFVLTHSKGLDTAGDLRFLATANIFIASLLFGLAYLRTRSLALPLGLHFAANLTQGAILGFGVSGNSQLALFLPRLTGPAWMTGGTFGLEASVPGLITIIAATWLLYRRPNPSRIASENPAPNP
ncbi:MAG TPA: type II CAAX endopeptidase family protein [Thermoanaerobaculia bacterium]|nr:type II CAAX endopeptidase family protein [Thermoanaerobaculia bacterium]